MSGSFHKADKQFYPVSDRFFDILFGHSLSNELAEEFDQWIQARGYMS
jgi:hypothetical protein